MEVSQTPLPGVGVRYDFVTAAGRRLGLAVGEHGPLALVTSEAGRDGSSSPSARSSASCCCCSR